MSSLLSVQCLLGKYTAGAIDYNMKAQQSSSAYFLVTLLNSHGPVSKSHHIVNLTQVPLNLGIFGKVAR